MAIETTDIASKHIVLLAYEAWGHTRPFCVLAAKLVKLHHTHITIFTTQKFLQRGNAELARSFRPDEIHLLENIRVIALVHKGLNPVDAVIFDANFAEAFKALMKQEPIVCAETQVKHGPFAIPAAVFLDHFAVEPHAAVRTIGQNRVKIFNWYSGATSSLFYLFGPKHKGGKGDILPQVEEEARRTGKSIDVVADEALRRVDGTVVRVPGLPPMYDYEYKAQEADSSFLKLFHTHERLGKLWIGAYRVLETCDALVLTSPECYEPEPVAGAREWFAETSRKVYAIGPLLPSESQSVGKEKDASSQGAAIEHFLDTVLESHGEKSLLYVSFGSLWWPTDTTKLWAFLDVVMDMKIPFIMSHASPLAQVPDTVREKVETYGLGLLSQWTPQQTILAHAATGWFVTHCGHNSVIESVTHGVPMLCWPFQADQPTNAVHLTDNLDVAYELIEVRTGEHGLKPIYRTGRVPVGTVEAMQTEAKDILAKAFGEDGARKRANMKRLQLSVVESWHDNGPSARALEELMESL